MVRYKLSIEKGIAAFFHQGGEIGQRRLAGVGGAREHAFAEKGAAETEAIKPADQLAVLPALDAMGEAGMVQIGEQADDFRINPGFRPPRGRLGAKFEHPVESGVDLHLESAAL